jgi:hypothetical protein
LEYRSGQPFRIPGAVEKDGLQEVEGLVVCCTVTNPEGLLEEKAATHDATVAATAVATVTHDDIWDLDVIFVFDHLGRFEKFWLPAIRSVGGTIECVEVVLVLVDNSGSGSAMSAVL